MKTILDFYLFTRLQQGCLVILFYIAYNFFSVKRRKTYVHKLFSAIVCVSIFDLICDMITVYTVNHLELVPDWLNHLLHIVFVGSTAGVIYCTYLYVRSLVYSTVNKPLNSPLATVPFILALLCIAIFPIHYDHGEHTNYSNGLAVFSAYACIILYFIHCFVLLIKYRRRINKKQLRGIVTALISIIVITSIQGIIHESLISSLGVTMLNLAFFFTLENPDATLIEELEYARNKADEANKAKSNFLANMSHEIRTPINAVLGMNEMIMRESSEDEVISYAKNIHHAGQTLLSIVNDILDFSKVEEGKMEILPTQYDLVSVITDLVNMIRPRTETKGLELEVNANEDIPRLLFGDEIRIKQCMLNILTNSVKYTEKGSVRMNIDFEKKDKSSVILKISIADTGIGIREEDLKKLFKPFKRIEESRNRTIEGTGLGLNITQSLLHLMGSKLQVESVYGQGSVFSFNLEQKVIQWEPLGNYTRQVDQKKEEKYHEAFHAPKAHILVVDDTDLNLTVFKSLLKKTRITIDTALSGREALLKLAKTKYDMLFLDHLMPEMDGIQTLHEIKKLSGIPEDFPCIALTANAISGAREMFISEGFTDYLSKPVSGTDLEAMLLQYLPKEKIILKSDPSFIPDDDLTDSPMNMGDKRLLRNMTNIGLRVFDLHLMETLTNCGGYEYFYDVIHDFYSAIQDKSDLIEYYAKNQDFKNYTILVHALKSSARIIGAMQLHEEAKYLESCGNAEDAAEIAEKTPALLEHYRSYKHRLEPLLGIQPTTKKDKPMITTDNLENAFSSIKECAQAEDLQNIQNILNMLEDYTIPDAQTELYMKIKAKAAEKDVAAVFTLLS